MGKNPSLKFGFQPQGWEFWIIVQAVIALILGIPVLLIFLLPIFIAREIIKYLASFDKNLGEIMSSASSMMACVDDLYVRPRANILVAVTLKGQLTVEDLREQILRKAINARSSDGSLKFKEMQQFYFSYFGFLFWRWDRNFRVENHVKDFQGKLETEKELCEATSSILSRPWPRFRSPWEFWISPNYQTDSSVMIFKCHHSFGDGYALLALLLNTIGKGISVLPTPKYYKEETGLQKLRTYLSLPFLILYQAIEEFTYTRDENALHSDDKKTSGSRHAVICEAIPILCIKEIMKTHSVGFNSVISAAISGALRNYMIQNKMELPGVCHAISPVVYPGHPRTLVNHFTFNYTKFPVGVEDPAQRLKMCNFYDNSFINSTLPFSHFHGMKILGGVFCNMVRFLTDRLAETTAFYSNFPISNEMVTFQGHPVKDVLCSIGCINTHTGVGFACMTYNGRLRTMILADESTVPTYQATENLAELVAKEFYVLRKTEALKEM